MRKLITILLVFAIVLTFAACNNEVTSNKTQNNENSDIGQNNKGLDAERKNKSAAQEDWKHLSGRFVRDKSKKSNEIILQMKYLSNDCALFEFKIIDDSKLSTKDESDFAAILIVGDDGIGHYESLPDSEKSFKIDFDLSKDGKSVKVTHQGEMSISLNGLYTFIDNNIEASKASAIAILENLPTALTSLNHNNGAYTIQYSDELVENLYHPVQAVFNDNGVVLAKFLVAKDLSSIYRVDDDIKPVLIFGIPK